MHSTVSSIGERALVQRITSRLSQPPWVQVGPGDDAAVIEPEPRTLEVLTTDAQVEGIHFDRRFVPPQAIGHRALAVNLSDIAAMGGAPRAAVLSLMLPDHLDVADVDGLIEGMLALAGRHQLALVGGNITRSPGPLVVDVTVTGSVKPRRVLTRGGARAGDEVYVTGSIGDAAVGLRALQDGGTDPSRPFPDLAGCEERYLRPEPRVRLGVLLGRNRAASACMDLSDGLADGVRQIAEASNVGMVIDGDALPISSSVREWHEARTRDPVEAAIEGGDDYELLFTVRPAQRGRLRSVRRLAGNVPITRIGVVTRGHDLLVRTAAGDRPLPAGFEHFR